MPTLQRSMITLRITGDDLVPKEVSDLLACLPTASYQKGDVLVGKKSKTRNIAKFGNWLLTVPPREPADFDAQIAFVLSQLTTDLAVWKALSQRHYIGLFCGLFMAASNEGTSISATSLAALASRGISLELDIYGQATVDDTNPDSETLGS